MVVRGPCYGFRMVKSLPAVCLLLWSSLALSANQVTAVSATGGSVSISASAPPHFTTFTMSNPPRLVVDLAEATFQGVPAEIAVGANDIVGIKTLNYGSGASAVARVMITYTKDVDTDIVTSGNNIVVRPSNPGPSMQEVPAGSPAPQIAGGSSVPVPAAPTAEAIPAAGDSPVQPAPPSKDEIATEAPPTEKVQTETQHNTAYAQNDYASQPPPSEAPAAAAPAPAAGGEEQPAAAAPAAGERTHADELAAPPPPAASGDTTVSSRRKRLELVGLRFNGSPAVFIRTNEPVHYSVKDNGTSLIVTIENTRITRHNDTRPLDVHFFDSPIAMVRARQVRRNVEVDIQLKNQAQYQAAQTGPEVALTFNH